MSVTDTVNDHIVIRHLLANDNNSRCLVYVKRALVCGNGCVLHQCGIPVLLLFVERNYKQFGSFMLIVDCPDPDLYVYVMCLYPILFKTISQ